MSENAREYHSAVDTWLLLVLLAAVGISLLGALEVIIVTPRSAWWIAAVLVVAGTGLPVWLLVDTRYQLDDRELRIRCGPFRWRVLLDSIHSVEPSSNPIASPALSLKRLKIRYGTGQEVLVSPRDPDAFREDLERLRRGDAGRD